MGSCMQAKHRSHSGGSQTYQHQRGRSNSDAVNMQATNTYHPDEYRNQYQPGDIYARYRKNSIISSVHDSEFQNTRKNIEQHNAHSYGRSQTGVNPQKAGNPLNILQSPEFQQNFNRQFGVQGIPQNQPQGMIGIVNNKPQKLNPYETRHLEEQNQSYVRSYTSSFYATKSGNFNSTKSRSKEQMRENEEEGEYGRQLTKQDIGLKMTGSQYVEDR